MTTIDKPIPPSAATPTVSPAIVRRLVVGVVSSNAAVAVIAAAVVLLTRRAEWWPAVTASVAIAAVGAAASVGILSVAAGRTVDWLVTFVMATAGARLFVSLIGLIVAVKFIHTPDEATGLLVCVFYTVTLVVETALLTRAAAAPAQVAPAAPGGSHVNLLAEADPQSHVVDHLLWAVNGVWLLGNHTVMIFVAAIIMLLLFPAITRAYRDGHHVPTGTRNFVEAIMMYIRNDVAKPLLGDDTDRFMPFLWTMFFFILILNLLGLLPLDALQNLIFNSGDHQHFHPISGTATSNFFVTAVLALIVFCVVQFNGIASNGFDGWLHHFLGGAPWWLAPIMIPVEFMGMVIKPFALAVRLAANMTAGHLLLAVLGGFVPLAMAHLGTGGTVGITIISIVASVAIMMLELFVALLQAYLFVFLSSLFISQMISHHHDDTHAHPEEEVGELGEPVAVREHNDDGLTTHRNKPRPAH